MKTALKCIVGFSLLAVLGATIAFAQNQYIKNVIVVIQENRTPDNLFQDQNLINAGADIIPPSTGGSCGNNRFQQTPLGARTLHDCVDPDHSHIPSWENSYDGGLMDGACTVPMKYCDKSGQNDCHCPEFLCKLGNSKGALDCTQYAYVSDPVIQPYWDIAEKYGFANYFFQTNQGPSFPAHQFILSGTSQPSANNPYYKYFAAENTTTGADDAGCVASSGSLVYLVDTTGAESTSQYPCFSHPTLATLLDNAGVAWRYYSDKEASIWTAPNAIGDLCGASGGHCQSAEWQSNVGPNLEGSLRYINGMNQPTLAPFMYDLTKCKLSDSGGVYFVVPDGKWSDHALNNIGLGPDWVADIVNGVGYSTCTGGQPNWSNTVILIVWDDWGGWYDHVNPISTIGGGNLGYVNGNGNGQAYVYGFRVPLLVVSAYVKETNGQPGYISGTKQSPLYYDFGSILQFIKETYGITDEIDSFYHDADYFAKNYPTTSDLSDFFLFCGTCQRTFLPIPLSTNSNCNQNTCKSNQCDATCFINYGGGITDPDTE